MIGIDTNVLVRHTMQDDVAQARVASRLLASLTRDEPGHVSAVVLAELAWVLSQVYGATRSELVGAIEALLAVDVLAIEHADCAHRAVAVCEAGGDFADALIAEIDAEAGCKETVTLDKQAAKRSGMRLLQ